MTDRQHKDTEDTDMHQDDTVRGEGLLLPPFNDMFPVSVYLELYVWEANTETHPKEKPPKHGREVYSGKRRFIYIYTYANGAPYRYPIPMQTTTNIQIKIYKSRYPSHEEEKRQLLPKEQIKGYSISNLNNHGMVRFEALGWNMASTAKDFQQILTCTDCNPVSISCWPELRTQKKPQAYKLTIFVELDGIIIPCDPEVRDEGEED
jgi:hypothetical protein